ncbi:hypothetical protein PaG_06438 [Moesziomyces aphidis]|uniref:Transcription factor domain-containing protein n=1 Tax=Moesziomyces aphidis TaxID=84754 RepID=W3VD96_MOEAP|nr:hypothetical protein PaG_06438 [Moesziomyces aphidis]
MDGAQYASRKGKRALVDSCPSSSSKIPRTCPPISSGADLPPYCPNTSATNACPSCNRAEVQQSHRSRSPQASSPSPSSSSSSSSRAVSSADPFPRYELGIPHLDVLLPTRDGLDLLHAYQQGVGWINTPVDRTTLLETLEEAQRHGPTSIHPHRLACLLAALALGDLFGPCFPSSLPSSSRPSAHSPSKRGKIWFGVASACLAGSRPDIELMHSPTPDACSALYLMSIYLLCSNDDELFQRSQGLTGLALILAKAALVPSCLPSSRPIASRHTTASASLHANLVTPWQPVPSTAAQSGDNDRLQCNRLLSDLIFHLQCQVLTLALPCTSKEAGNVGAIPLLANVPDIPTIQAIWTAFGTPLYASIDAFGSRFSPNIFHNWKLGLADLMHQVSCLTSPSTAAKPTSPSSSSAAGLQAADKDADVRPAKPSLPDHSQIVKLDERIRRYHASLPDFLLLHRPLPVEMAGKVDEDELAQIICQRHMACSMVHRMLMALHRPWFLSALATKSRPPHTKTAAKHGQADIARGSETAQSNKGDSAPPAPQPSASDMYSLSAVLRSATWQTETFASAASCAPPQALAWWQFTNNALAASVVQATALLRLCGSGAPGAGSSGSAKVAGTATSEPRTATSQFHRQVRTDLDKNVCSFQNVAKRCKLAARALPFLQRVCAAIDTGLCKSKTQQMPDTDALQTSLDESERPLDHNELDACGLRTNLPQHTSPSQHRPDTDNSNSISTRIHPETASDISNSISNSISINSNINSKGHLASNSKVTNDNNIAGASKTTILMKTSKAATDGSCSHSSSGEEAASGLRPALHCPRGEAETACARTEQLDSRPAVAVRRASSANSRAGSDLEAIFGPIAQGLEPPEATSAPRTSAGLAKPFYRQNWDPLSVPRDADRSSSQAPHSDAGSSSSSTMPVTPAATLGSRSPRLGSRVEVPDATPSAVGSGNEGQPPTTATTTSRKKTSFESDLVLQCIRFWQPDLLAMPSRASAAPGNT